MVSEFKTISKSGEGVFKDRGSKFLGFTFHITNEDEIKDALYALRKEYYDARHHCYAYVLGDDRKTYRANDDGEPNHSAGDPILGQIHSYELTNILVVVIRYFGGTKLGVSGLINAYKTSAQLAIDNSTIVKEEVKATLILEYDYNVTNEVMRLVREFEIGIQDEQYLEYCLLIGNIRINKVNALKEKIQLLNNTGTEVFLKFD